MTQATHAARPDTPGAAEETLRSIHDIPDAEVRARTVDQLAADRIRLCGCHTPTEGTRQMSEKRVACVSERTLRSVAALAAALLPADRRGTARISRAVMLRAAAAVLMLAASVAVPTTASAQTPPQNSAAPYADVDSAAFYAAAVEELHADGVFAGTEYDDGFCPDAPIDRATMAV